MSLCALHLHYRPQENGTVMTNKRAEKFDDFLSEHPSVSIHNCGDFSIPKRGYPTLTKLVENVDKLKTPASFTN